MQFKQLPVKKTKTVLPRINRRNLKKKYMYDITFLLK